MAGASGCTAITVVFGVLLFASTAQATTVAPASLAFEPSSYYFGVKVPATGPSLPEAFRLTNTGEFSLSVNYVSLTWSPQEFGDPEIFKITSNDCMARLAPGESCAIEVVFDPQLPGPKWGTLTVSAPFGEHCFVGQEGKIICLPINISAQVQMTGVARTISLSPPSLTFLPREVGGGPSPPKTVTVTNEGELDVKIYNVMLVNHQHPDANQFRILGGTCVAEVELPAKGTCTVEVAFSPSAPGDLAADLGILDSAAGGQQFATLEGEGVAPETRPQPPPEARVFIIRRPAKLTTKRVAVFAFQGTQSAVGFECKLDSRPFRVCESPVRFRHLRLGHHDFAVRAVDGDGLLGPAGAQYRWRIEARR